VTTERIPPHSQEAEAAVVGAILLEPKALLAVRGMLAASDFYRAEHSRLFSAYLALADERAAIDHISVKAQLRRAGAAELAANADLFLSLGNQVPSVANAEHYAKIVRDKSLLRQTIAVCTDALRDAYSEIEPDELLKAAQGKLLTLQRGAQWHEAKGMRPLLDALQRSIDHKQPPAPAIPTGLVGIDQIMGGGVRAGHLIIIGGRPSTGKSTLAQNVFANWTTSGMPSLFFSLEVRDNDVARNVVACTARLSTLPLQEARLTEVEMAHYLRAAAQLYQRAEHNLVYDHSSLTPGELRNVIQQQALRQPVKAVIVDYLQLMDSDTKHRERIQSISEISRQLKIIAREENIALIALSQLSRAADQDDRPPRLSHLRESGTIEQDADEVILIHAKRNKDELPGDYVDTDLIFAKQRSGPTTVARMVLHRNTLKFLNETEARLERGELAAQIGDRYEP